MNSNLVYGISITSQERSNVHSGVRIYHYIFGKTITSMNNPHARKEEENV